MYARRPAVVGRALRAEALRADQSWVELATTKEWALQTAEQTVLEPLSLRVGQLVEVRGAEEILATLDENGELDSLPFMPEMLRYCGQRLTVYRSAHKACDTISRTGVREMTDAVHLIGDVGPVSGATLRRTAGTDVGVRCDGSAHDGCQAACLIYWKTAWLRPVDDATAPVQPAVDGQRLLPLLTIASRRPDDTDGAPRYRCQSTEMLRATPRVLPIRHVSQYVRDVRTGNVGALWSLRAFLVGLFNRLQMLSARRLPRWLRFRGGLRWRFLKGQPGPTPTRRTNLQPGDLVRVRSKEEIMKTLDVDLKNRGMGFDAEMARFCGRTARVARRVDHIIDETTGRMISMKNPCIVLEGIVCEGAYIANCPRSITAYWREIWLEKVDG
jgi:hypothetical protein